MKYSEVWCIPAQCNHSFGEGHYIDLRQGRCSCPARAKLWREILQVSVVSKNELCAEGWGRRGMDQLGREGMWGCWKHSHLSLLASSRWSQVRNAQQGNKRTQSLIKSKLSAGILGRDGDLTLPGSSHPQINSMHRKVRTAPSSNLTPVNYSRLGCQTQNKGLRSAAPSGSVTPHSSSALRILGNLKSIGQWQRVFAHIETSPLSEHSKRNPGSCLTPLSFVLVLSQEHLENETRG